MRRPIADRFAGPAVDQLPVNSIGTAGHAQAAALAFVKRIAAGALVLPVDVEEAHLVAARWIGIAIVAMDAEELVEKGKILGRDGFGFLAEEDVGFLAVED